MKDKKLNAPLILVIDDDPQIRRLLRTILVHSSYNFLEADTAQKGLSLVRLHHPDLVILDLELPDKDGLDVTRELREWSAIPIIVVSARNPEVDKITVLDLGADDYLTKPFDSNELLARIRVELRHAMRAIKGSDDPIFTVGGLRVDIAHRQVFVDDIETHLTPIEYRLLLLLVQYAGKVVTHHQLLNEVWGPLYTNEAHYLRVYMGQLRHKIEPDPNRPRYIMTEMSIGYRLKTE